MIPQADHTEDELELELLEQLEAEDTALCEESLYHFIKAAWHIVEPGKVFYDGWHIQKICEALEKAQRGEIRRLIINIPPRHMKSTICAVMFPVWAWLQKPGMQFLFASYAGSLSMRDSVKCRRLIQSAWFQHRWASKFQLTGDQNTKTRFDNTSNGYRLATSVDGTATGEGGDIICLPGHEVVQTEHGPIPIADLVASKAPVKVWAFDRETGGIALAPVTGWHTNPASNIVRVSFNDGSTLDCTPDHKLWTSRGWVEAAALRLDDMLPGNPFTDVCDSVSMNSVPLGKHGVRSNALANSANVFLSKASVGMSLAKRSVGLFTQTIGELAPCAPLPHYLNSSGLDVEPTGKDFRSESARHDLNSHLAREFGLRPCLIAWQATVRSRISNILLSRTISQVASSIVERIAIKVPYVFPRLALAYEGPSNNLMDVQLPNDSCVTDIEPEVSVVGRCLDAPSRYTHGLSATVNDPGQAPNEPRRGDLVMWDAGYRTPVNVELISHESTTYCLSTGHCGTFLAGNNSVFISNCIDDPHNVREVESAVTRQGVLDWWDGTMQTRLNDFNTGIFIIIMQRVHESDLCGHILKEAQDDDSDAPEWTHLCFPARYEADHPHVNSNDPRTKEGELLWSNRMPGAALNSLEKKMGRYQVAGQMQQRPSPKGGGILRRTDWQLWDYKDNGGHLLWPNIDFFIQSWDTAYSEKDDAAYSARTDWGVFTHNGRTNAMLMGMWRGKVRYSKLRKEAKEAYVKDRPDAVLIEKKASGQSLIQDLRQIGIPVIEYMPDRDKVARAHATSILLENHLIWYPDRIWAKDVVDACSSFPAGDGADIVDTCTQAWIRLRNMWFLVRDDDLLPEDKDFETPVKEVVYG